MRGNMEQCHEHLVVLVGSLRLLPLAWACCNEPLEGLTPEVAAMTITNMIGGLFGAVTTQSSSRLSIAREGLTHAVSNTYYLYNEPVLHLHVVR